jgi:hypothetical protein
MFSGRWWTRENAVGGRIAGGGGHYGLLTVGELYDLAVALLESGMGAHHPEEVRPQPHTVRNVVAVKAEVLVIEEEDHFTVPR